MSLILTSYEIQHRGSWLHSPSLFYLKLVLLVLTAIVYIFYDYRIVSALVFVDILLIVSIKGYRLIVESLVIYLPPTLIIISIDYVSSTLTYNVLYMLLYGYASLLSITLFYATTPIQQLYDRLGLNPLTLALLMLNNIVAELTEIVETKKARGWDPGLNPLNHFIIVFEAVKLAIIRIEEITIALKTRGVD